MLLWFYPVTVDDAKRASTIYGPFVANLKGTATKSTADYVVSLVPIPLPPSILEHHQHLTLCIDILYVKKFHFLPQYPENSVSAPWLEIGRASCRERV